MESAEPDRSDTLTASSVIRGDFRTVRRGFDADEVTAHLGRVAEHVADLESRIIDLEAQLSERDRAVPGEEAARLDAYESVAARIADLVRTFDSDVERLRTDAQGKADRLLQESRAEAERIRREAEKLQGEATAEAERVVSEARGKADSVLTTLSARRAALLENCRRIQEGLTRTLASIDGVLREATEGGAMVDASGASVDEEAHAAGG